MKHIAIFLSVFILITGAASAGQTEASSSTLVIHIKGFETSKGVAKVSVVNSKENYNAATPFKGFNLKITNNKVKKAITLPHGEYAIKVYHDENANNELDTRIFGIPIERYGFSNNARGTLGPPEYKDAVFTLHSPKKEITITLE